MATTKNDKPKELKVTDKRIFTPEGDLREEFRNNIKPAEPQVAKPAERSAERPAEKPPQKQADKKEKEPPRNERKRGSIAEKAPSPGTQFTDFVERLIVDSYMLLGMLPNPYGGKMQVDTAAARQMIDIITMLKDKTAGNLTAEEDDFLTAHLAELKLAFVQRTKTI